MGNKHKSFWPLPGGIRNYHYTLYQILEFARSNPNFTELKTWLMKKYDLDSERTTRGYLDVVRKLDLLQIQNNTCNISSIAKELLETKDDRLIFNILLEKIAAIKEILEIISEKQPIGKTEINKELENQLHFGWKTDAQTVWRLNWLLSLGYIELTSGKYYFTEKGIEELNRLKKEIVEKAEETKKDKQEKLEEISHSDLEDKIKHIGDFFEFDAIKKPKINIMLPEDRQLKSSGKELDGLWIKKIPMGGKIFYPIEIQIGGNLSDTIDRLETVSDFAQKAIIVIDGEQEKIFRERLTAKRSKLIDKIVCIRPEDVNKIMSATNALKAFFIELFR